MTVTNPPSFLQALSTHTAEQTRRSLRAIVAPGVVDYGLEVTEKSGTPNMSVDVAAGQVVIEGDESSFQGVYICDSRSSENLPLSAADGSNDRYDLIVAQVEDSAYSGATDAWSLAVVEGTPAAFPTVPTPPDNAVVLAYVLVGTGVSSVTDSDITDRRIATTGQTYAAAVGAKLKCLSTNRPSSPWAGLELFETDTLKSMIYDGSAWVATAYHGAWDTWTPTVTQSSTRAGTTNLGIYRKLGRRVDAMLLWTAGANGSADPLYVSYPGSHTPASTANPAVGDGWIYNGSNRLGEWVATASGLAFMRDGTGSFYSDALVITTHAISLNLTYTAAA